MAITDMEVAPAGSGALKPPPSPAWLVLPGMVFLFFVLLLPVGWLMALSLKPSMAGAFSMEGDWTIANYLRFFSQPFYYSTLIKTLWVSGLTTVITAVIGYALALVIWTAKPAHRGWIVLIVLSPLLVSIVARTYGWMIVLGDRGILNQFLLGLGLIDEPIQIMYTSAAVIVGLVHVFVPFMALCILTSLDKIDPNVPEAAMTFGAGRLAVLTRILVPLTVPGLASGLTIVFSLSISSYVTPALMGGPRSGMLTTFIYQQFAVTLDWRFGAVLVTLLLALTLLVLTTILALAARMTAKWSKA
ncbi:ABC transporter permease [Rhodobacterales bacterium]|nr:ABC transporter permease [Rhodobacterales bacterium]